MRCVRVQIHSFNPFDLVIILLFQYASNGRVKEITMMNEILSAAPYDK